MPNNVIRFRDAGRRKQRFSPRRRRPDLVRRCLYAAFSLIFFVTLGIQAWQYRGGLIAAVTPGCSIKGNVSPNTGERIYHAPGQSYYAETRVKLFSNERWFCTEAEAVAAGFRRARL